MKSPIVVDPKRPSEFLQQSLAECPAAPAAAFCERIGADRDRVIE